MKKRFFAALLSFIMVFSLLPVNALAKLTHGETQPVTFQVLYVDDSFNVGYSFGAKENTTYTCQYTTNHSDDAYTNHSIAISDIKAAADRASVYSGYQIVGWSKEAKRSPTINEFPAWLNGKTTACNKGDTIYLVAKNPTPTVTYTLYYDKNDGTGVCGTDTTTPTRAESFNFEVRTKSELNPTRDGYNFLGWADESDAKVPKYTGDERITLYKADPTKTIYAVWEENAPVEPTEPSKEDIKELLGSNAVQIICTNGESNHGSKTFGLIDDTFTVRYDNQYTCEVTIGSFNEYVKKFNTELDVAQGTHSSDISKADEEKSIINLRWADGKWTVMDAPAKHYVRCVTPKYTVTYTDGVDTEEVFADQVYGNLPSGTATPAFNGTPTRTDYVFAGWKPAVARTVTGNATYVAQWKDDKNNNGTPDDEEDKYTVTYTDGVDGEVVFADQVYDNLLSGTATPAFNGTPTRTDYVFAGWNPEVAEKVTENATYTAQWKEDKNHNGTPDDEEEKYTVTYTDGVNGEEVFADQVYGNLLSGTTTPAFNGTPTRTDHVFAGWEPAVSGTVTKSVTYVAQWKDDKNNNGTPDDEEDKYTVTYTDGVDGEVVFADQVYDNLLSGTTTPAFNGTPARTDYVFVGWNPKVAEKVTENATYAAQWKEDKNHNGIPDENDDKYTVTYTDGVDGEEVFADQVYDNLLSGTATPAFNGTPTRDGYRFTGWEPAVSGTVTESVTYAAQWTARTDLSYTVHYYLKNTTKKVANDKRVNGQTFNAVVEEEAIPISGYRVHGDSVKSITIGTGTNDIIFYYTRASRPSASSTSKPTLNTGDHYAYVMGYPDGTVRPNGSITRAEVSAILFRLLSDETRDEYFTTESSFTDVKAGAWYNNSIATLEKAGVIVDTAKGGAFRPNEAITRAELAAMLAQFSDAKPVKGVKFSDVSAEHWAYEAIAIAAKMGWIEGYPDGTFRPDATITRAEMMTLVNRALERVPSDEDHLLSKRVMLTFPDCKSGDWFYIAVQEATNSHTYERAATEKNGDEQWTALRANRDWTLIEK